MLIGLDKQTIKPNVIGIDYNRLKELPNVVIDTEGRTYPIYDYKSDTELLISHINIIDDNVFNRLTIGTYKGSTGATGLFCYLDISKMGTYDCNLVPYTVEGFRVYTDKCLKYIEDMYGVKLEANRYKGERMEMNVTITLEDRFTEYSYLLELMAKLSPKKKRYKTELYYDKDNECTGLKLKNGSMEKKVYDKRKQLEQEKEIKIILDKEYMRIEDTLNNQNKIRDVFGSYDIADITDEAVKEYMVKSIEEDLIKPMEKHIEAGNKLLLKTAKAEYKKNNKKWIQSFIISALTLDIKGVPILVDKQQIIDVMALMITNKSNYNRAVKRAVNDLDKLNKYIGNLDKLSEIKSKCNI